MCAAVGVVALPAHALTAGFAPGLLDVDTKSATAKRAASRIVGALTWAFVAPWLFVVTCPAARVFESRVAIVIAIAAVVAVAIGAPAFAFVPRSAAAVLPIPIFHGRLPTRLTSSARIRSGKRVQQ
jgi:hypothetical protein